jgi:hypothetical protein
MTRSEGGGWVVALALMDKSTPLRFGWLGFNVLGMGDKPPFIADQRQPTAFCVAKDPGRPGLV